MYAKRVTLFCDNCSAMEEFATHRATDARAEAREMGWSCSSDEDLCPECRGSNTESEISIDDTDVPEWEFDAIYEVEQRWGLDPTEAENFLVGEGVLD